MHAIAHDHLVHTEVCDKPKCIENKVCTTSFPAILITRGIGSRAMKRSVFPPFNHWLTGGAANTMWQINSRCSSFYLSSPGFHCLDAKVALGQEVTQLCRTSMAYFGALPSLTIMFLKYAKYAILLQICTICMFISYLLIAQQST